ncbi:hypothetical protein EYF80_029192 [Liparis tanakae]|uniref:Uncharacterized protein n=1 Tax=Liparis tanakae TaxID=230148 RepID=A0A4Z2H4N6_9TELE|nr:hypothetical protein EYF80_029192 [Liparis tanakae]
MEPVIPGLPDLSTPSQCGSFTDPCASGGATVSSADVQLAALLPSSLKCLSSSIRLLYAPELLAVTSQQPIIRPIRRDGALCETGPPTTTTTKQFD